MAVPRVSSPNPAILFRVDGGIGVGSGHLMRCLALAQCFAEAGSPCHLLTDASSDPGLDAWQAEGIVPLALAPAPSGSPDDWDRTIAAASALAAPWLVVDGYAIGLDYERAVTAAGLGLVRLDDLCQRPFAADLVVNANAGAERRYRYDLPAGGRALLGTAYAQPRKALRHAAEHRPPTPAAALLITLGGADSANVGLSVARALADRLGLDLPPTTLVCSAGAEGLREARAFAAALCGRLTCVPPGEIAPMMAQSGLIICGGGVTALECAFLGVPAVVVVMADNQAPGTAALAEAGAVHVATAASAAGEAIRLLGAPHLRHRMAAAGRRVVDGQGARRILAAMQDMRIGHG